MDVFAHWARAWQALQAAQPGQHMSAKTLQLPPLRDAQRTGLRRLWEPLAFVGATLALGGLASISLVLLTLMLLSGGLILAILHHIFGIDLAALVPEGAA